MSTTRLAEFVIKKAIRAESIPGFEEMEVLGVSNKLGITVTDHKKSKDLAKYLLIEEGDFAYNPYRINVGSIGLVPAGKRGLVSPAYVVFKTTDELIPELLLDFLKSQEGLREISKYARGTVRKALRFEDLAQIELPVPPKDKQREILAKRKSIEVEVASVKSELVHQQTLLKKLRQQILQEAIEGKLTADWRAKNPDVEPASEPLKRIAAEKAQLVKDKKIKAQKPLPPITDKEKLFELPPGWQWCRLGDLCDFITKGTTPAASELLKEGEIPYLKVYNIVNQKIDFHYKPQFVRREVHEKLLARSRAYPNDVLMNIVGPPLGKVAIVPNDFPEWNINQAIAIFRPIEKEMSKYIYTFLCEGAPVKAVELKGVVGQDNISLTQSRELLMGVPPLQEQQAIVTKVKKLLDICDQLEVQITQNQTHSEQLMQAVLKEAFNHNSTETQKANTVVTFKPKGSDYYKRTLLAAEIVYQLQNEPTFGHLKLQKLIYLCQKSENMQLPLNFLQQAAGPYDPKMARSLDKQLYDKGWFQYQREEMLKYKPLQKAGEHKSDFQKYFSSTQAGIKAMIDLFRTARSDQMEIVATLYACWENLTESQSLISNEILIQQFYAWSEEKIKYPEDRLLKAIAWMQAKKVIPVASYQESN